MEKGMSSGEGLPSRSPQASAAKVTVKESETRQPCEEKRGGFVLVHAGETLCVSWNGSRKEWFPFLALKLQFVSDKEGLEPKNLLDVHRVRAYSIPPVGRSYNDTSSFVFHISSLSFTFTLYSTYA